MTEVIQLALSFGIGGLLATFYFLGLWWTVQRLPHAQHKWLLYFGSLFLRLLVMLVSFYGVLVSFSPYGLIACLGGFVVVRMLLIHTLSRDKSQLSEENVV